MTPERSGGSPTSLEAELIELKARVAKVCAVASMGDDWASGEHFRKIEVDAGYIKHLFHKIDALTAELAAKDKALDGLKAERESAIKAIARFEIQQIEAGKTLLELQSIVNQLAAELRKLEGQ